MCLVVLICFDGLIFLGLDFLYFAVNWIEGFFILDLEENEGFWGIEEVILGDDKDSKLGFIGEVFGFVFSWMGDFVSDWGIILGNVVNSL